MPDSTAGAAQRLGLDLIDCHVHCFPQDDDARDFMRRVVRRPEAATIGTVAQLEEAIRRSGLHRTNILMYTPASIYYEDGIAAIPPSAIDRSAAQERVRRDVVARIQRNNDWASDFVRTRAGFSFFCGIDPVHMTEREMLEGIDRWVLGGAKGVKFVPASLKLFGNDRRLFPVYDYCHERRIPILAQSAGNPAPGHPLAYGHPAPYGDALRQFPRLRLIFAHMAYFPYLPNNGAGELQALTSKYPGIGADMSLRLAGVADGSEPAEWLASAVKLLGPEHILFGTNFPLADPAASVEAFARLPLSDRDRETIGHKNFERLTSRG